MTEKKIRKVLNKYITALDYADMTLLVILGAIKFLLPHLLLISVTMKNI